ncbi:MAG: FCD domain-containing protein [Actinophytocola sp.]|uniref:FCD domain-containing protein n=1 Tax=Actinophytocola sp. TaxID=1872138 RepID=UPI003D6B32F0
MCSSRSSGVQSAEESSGQGIRAAWIGLGGMMATAILQLAIVAVYRIRAGRRIGSAALVAEGQHARADGLTSIAVVVGVVGVWLGFERADAIAGLLIGVVVLGILISTMRSVFRRLMDGVEPGIVDGMTRTAGSVDGEHPDDLHELSGHHASVEAREGFVEVRPRQGYRVSVVTLAGVRDLFEMRLLLEPAAVELAAARASDEELADLHPLAHETYVDGDRASYERFLQRNREFHVRIARAAGNERLARTLQGLLEEMQRLFFIGLRGDDTADRSVRAAAGVVLADTTARRSV